MNASKNCFRVLGSLILLTRIGQLKVRVKFLVVQIMATNAILGTNFIVDHVRVILQRVHRVGFQNTIMIAIVGYRLLLCHGKLRP